MTGAAPLDSAALADALRPFGESRMLPAAAYTDQAVLAWERRHLFAGAWTCAGRADDLFGGDGITQRALTVGDVAVLLTVAPDSETVRGFANVCRHRGHELLPDGGTAGRPSVVCPYHGWAYRLDGSLATAPGMGAAARTPFDPGRYGLVELPVEVWHGWVFVNALGTAPPFPSHLGELAGLIAPYRPEDLVRGAGHVYQVAANWKVIVENYQECYHCPLIHPELCRVSPPASGQNWALPGAWVGGAMDLRDGAETMSLDGRSAGEYIDGAPRGTVRYIAVFPNLLISAHPDYVMTHRLEPLSPDLTRVECAWYFPRTSIDPGYAVDFWDITNREDWAACESVQRGLASPHFRPGPLAAGEDAVYQWVSLLARCYLDPIGALGAACVDTGRVNRGQ
ncbi:aromatic ring-hydroxylating oxygenase subunit alpha [Rugosimonospora africana]|uniref:(2Fe-2S)-binding protein n=1 Tax=Rugosimonospora africana TaxID=556532 RepID=A0A8J3VPP8_9ACTN|nr:aromatic ring-hydroxylating dioxygenase subunit alpha [Rugosimonospora africana]GIH13646.1 (2Fe-2S)-binding protein [Rugosimonospora africana]